MPQQFPAPTGPHQWWIEVDYSGDAELVLVTMFVENGHKRQLGMSKYDAIALADRLLTIADTLEGGIPLAATRIDSPVWDNVLSVRTINALVNAFGQYREPMCTAPLAVAICGMPDAQLIRAKNFGVKGLQQVQRMRALIEEDRQIRNLAASVVTP